MHTFNQALRSILMIAATAWMPAALQAQDVHVHVSPDAANTATDTATFQTIQYAMDHAPQPGAGGRLFVHIAPGVYTERVMVTANRPRTTFLGHPADPSKVVITGSQNSKSAGGTFFSATTDIEAAEFQADGITFANTAGNTGQAVALAVRSDKAVFKHCRFLGDQDTLFADFGRQFYTAGYITGGVDFIFGKRRRPSFDHVEIHEQRPAFLTAQSRTDATQPTGYVIIHSTITVDDLAGKTFSLGRPWRPYARVIVMETVLPAQLNPQGWSPWHPNEVPDHAFYAEYNNTGPGAIASPATAARAPWSRQLSKAEAEPFTPAFFLRGADHWDPLAEAAKLP